MGQGEPYGRGTGTFCCLVPLLPAGRRAPAVQSSICPVPIRFTPARMPESFSGECPTQSTSSRTTRSGSGCERTVLDSRGTSCR